VAPKAAPSGNTPAADAADEASSDEAEEGPDDSMGHASDKTAGAVDPDDMEEFDGTVLDLHDHPGGGAGDDEPESHTPPSTATSPLAKLSDDEIRRLVKEDIAGLGPLSLGLPNHGRLVNGVQMPKGDHWMLTDPGDAWGTPETIDNLTLAIERVNKDIPDTPKLVIGHISAQHGGHLSPHLSHQQGRDVDISYFYKDSPKWYAVATEENLDKPRTWAFVKTLVKETPVEMIFIDSSIQRLLKDYALSIGEDPKWLDQVFQVGSRNPMAIVRHAKGHATHIHIRFFSPIAQASARIAARFLPRKDQPSNADADTVASHGGSAHATHVAKQEYILHRARSGDTLDSLARRYGVTVKDIQDANGLTSNRIKNKATYRIPKLASTSTPGARPGARSAKQRN
jgi:murein endopeptidase